MGPEPRYSASLKSDEDVPHVLLVLDSPIARLYASLMGQGDIPTSPGGPLRRRREKRQLQQLAAETRREPSPIAPRAHVSVIEDQTVLKDRGPEAEVSDTPPEPLDESRPRGFHVHAVPIDQPLDDT